jgi:hypothetical protein
MICMMNWIALQSCFFLENKREQLHKRQAKVDIAQLQTTDGQDNYIAQLALNWIQNYNFCDIFINNAARGLQKIVLRSAEDHSQC